MGQKTRKSAGAAFDPSLKMLRYQTLTKEQKSYLASPVVLTWWLLVPLLEGFPALPLRLLFMYSAAGPSYPLLWSWLGSHTNALQQSV